MKQMLIALMRRRVLFVSGALLLVGACGSLLGPSNPPLQFYRLDPPFQAQGSGPAVSWQLAVARPQAAQTLDTERIALLRGAMMDYYADAQWNDTVPRLIQSLLVEAFEKSGRVPGVARESEGVRAEYRLQSDVRDFDAQYDSANPAPLVVVEIETRLVNSHGDVLTSLDSRQTARATQNNVAAVVQAFDQALAAALEQIVSWAAHAPSRSRADATK